MSELMLSQIQAMIERVSSELETMGQAGEADQRRMLGALGDLTAHSQAVMVVLAAFLKAHPVDRETVLAVLDGEEAESGVRSAEIRQRIEALVAGA